MRLYEPLPISITVSGKEYKIPVDFRIWLRISKLMSGDTPEEIKLFNICSILFGENYPDNFMEAFEKITDFMHCGKDIQKGESGGSALYDIDFDAEYIYAAFYQQYGINLSTADLHWWEFKALLSGLCGECLFTKILEYRSTDISKIQNKDLKKHMAQMKKIFALPDMRSDSEKEQDFTDIFAKFY